MSILARLFEQRPRRVNVARRDGVEPVLVDVPDALDVLVNDPLQNPRALTREEYAAALRRHDLAMKRLDLDAASYTPPWELLHHEGQALRRAFYGAPMSKNEQMAEFEREQAHLAYRRR